MPGAVWELSFLAGVRDCSVQLCGSEFFGPELGTYVVSRRASAIITHRPHSSSFLGLPCRILNMNPKKELLRGLWVSLFNY